MAFQKNKYDTRNMSLYLVAVLFIQYEKLQSGDQIQTIFHYNFVIFIIPIDLRERPRKVITYNLKTVFRFIDSLIWALS